ncbi:MAG: phosphoribosylaminoimidazolesuccinocarboxamide synthase [Proteobacteria bacterium]|nr:phosphoribosylaminoimidazolesuccinocarboxamide synthase [Pseudomonadota bacterium]
MGMTAETVVKTNVKGLKLLARGKVRDIYDLGDKLLIVATDRLSAFDYVLPTPIPGKGETLTRMSAFWFEKTARIVPNHFLSVDLKEIQRALPKGVKLAPEQFEGRSMLVKKAKRFDAECVVRGYVAGSGWKDYVKTGAICGHPLPKGLKESQQLKSPIFTPATKADTGHDENISFEAFAKVVGAQHAVDLKHMSVALYEAAAAHLQTRGLLLADTKFEFGLLDGKLIVIDEMVTPDSSRIWEESEYRVGTSPASFDKQFVRNWLEKSGWNKQPPVPSLPDDVVRGTSQRYAEAFRRITQ